MSPYEKIEAVAAALAGPLEIRILPSLATRLREALDELRAEGSVSERLAQRVAALQPRPVPDANGLLPCPFCGGPGKVLSNFGGLYFVECWTPGCGGTTSCRDSAEEAATAWNTRAALQAKAPTEEGT